MILCLDDLKVEEFDMDDMEVEEADEPEEREGRPKTRRKKHKHGFLYRNIANFITFIRILLAIAIVPAATFSKLFFVIFTLIGFTDALDGHVARKLKIDSKFGMQFDGIVDGFALTICLIKMIMAINLWKWIWVWTSLIAALRFWNLIVGYKNRHLVAFTHTLANKASGFIFFLIPYCYIYFDPNIIAAPLCLLATLAAIQEAMLVRTKKKINHHREWRAFKGMIGITLILTVFTTTLSLMGESRKDPSIENLKEEARAIKYNKFRTEYKANVSDEVEYYRYLVTLYCDYYEIEEYSELVLAMIQQESAGMVTDVMQSEASGYGDNTAIASEEESIKRGVQLLRDCLEIADVKGPDDIDRIKLAIQGYNYGTGYIDWALERDLGYTSLNAKVFSDIMKERYNYTLYGDPEYAYHVLRYYVRADDLTSAIEEEDHSEKNQLFSFLK